MEEIRKETIEPREAEERKAIIREVIEEFLKREQSKREPAYQAELVEERKKREALERKLNELVENKRQRQLREEAERSAAIRAELQRLGVSKVDLAFRAVKEDIYRTEDGRLAARGEQGEVSLKEYLTRFVQENPEFLPARISGGSGTAGAQRVVTPASGGVELEKIRPGMSREEAEKAREEIVRIAAQMLGGR